MPWVKLDDQFPMHPKIVAAGGDAAWLHVCALCYCATYLTDGILPKAMVERISDRKAPKRLAAKLVGVGSWIDRGDEYELHNYLEFNPSRAQVEADRERRAKAGKKGADARWHGTSHSKPDGTPHPNRIVSGDAPVPSRTPNDEDSRGEPFESDFDVLWKNYPRKVDRGAALGAYQARRREGTPHEALMRAVEAYSEATDGEDRQYVKHGATFMGKKGCWPEWVNGAPVDALGNQALGATPFAPEVVELGRIPEPQPCPLGVPYCDRGMIADPDDPPGAAPRECECRKVRVAHG